jgi:hypothetical protein
MASFSFAPDAASPCCRLHPASRTVNALRSESAYIENGAGGICSMPKAREKANIPTPSSTWHSHDIAGIGCRHCSYRPVAGPRKY